MKTKIKVFPMLILLLAIVLRVATESTANISFVAIALYALLGRSEAIQALAISWFFSMLNPTLVPDANAAAIGRYLVIFAAAISVAWRNKGMILNKFNLLTLLIGVLILVHSLLFSIVVDVSITKAIAWLIVVMVLLSAWQGLTFEQHAILFNQIKLGLVCLLFLSIPFLVIPEVGFARNGQGFQGLLNHPQAFGPTAALVAAMLAGAVLGKSKPRWRDLIFLGMSVVLIVLSEARTAGLAFALGVILSVIFSAVLARQSLRNMLPGLFSRQVQIAGFLAFSIILLAGSVLFEQLTKYIFKRTDATTFAVAAEASRGKVVMRMLDNIQSKPLTGIGFGISSLPEQMEVERDPMFNLPISAPIEKGVMPIAVIEELGLFGALAVFTWILVALRRGALAGVTKFSVLITLLLINLGEYVFFSVGGMGMLLLILTAATVTHVSRKSNTR